MVLKVIILILTLLIEETEVGRVKCPCRAHILMTWQNWEWESSLKAHIASRRLQTAIHVSVWGCPLRVALGTGWGEEPRCLGSQPSIPVGVSTADFQSCSLIIKNKVSPYYFPCHHPTPLSGKWQWWCFIPVCLTSARLQQNSLRTGPVCFIFTISQIINSQEILRKNKE